MNRATGLFSAGAVLGSEALWPACLCGECVCWECEVVQRMRGGRAGFQGAVAWSEMSIKPLALPRSLPFSLPRT